jgi:DNA polymerase-1
MPKELRDFREIWFVDFEYQSLPGEHVLPHCLVSHELRSGRRVRLWRDELGSQPPYPTDQDSLFCSYNTIAEMSCHLSLGWPLPVSILDLFVEFWRLTNGHELPDGRKLLGAMSYFKLDAIGVVEKKEMQDLAIRGAPFTEKERRDLLKYCESDVLALPKLLGRMIPKINLPQALHRGRCMRALAVTEFNGIPMDTGMLGKIRDNWGGIKLDLISEVDKKFGVYDKTRFKLDRFAALLRRLGIRDWPRTETGRLSKSEDTFRQMSRAHPVLQPLSELVYTIGKLRLEHLAVGRDHRNRTSFIAFDAKTSRNTYKAREYVFSQATWIRSLIKPREGFAVTYIDWSGQENAVAGALSGDEQMIQGYASGDPYLSFAKACGAIPPEATKDSHPEARDMYKLALLGIAYGMGKKSLALYIDQSVEVAEKILESHRRVYKKFWEWSDGILEKALLTGKIETCFGWRFSAPWQDHKPPKDEAKKKRKHKIPVNTIRNFPVQGNAGEMFRLACALMVERGLKLVALVHDAVLIESRLTEIDRDISVAKEAMAEAGRAVLKGRIEVRVDVKVFKDRFKDKRGVSLWETVSRSVETLDERRRIEPKQEQLGLWA